MDTTPTVQNRFVMGIWSDDAGNSIGHTTDGGIRFSQKHLAGSQGFWDTPNNSLGLNGWHHIVVTKDASVDPTTDPKIYIDGVLQTLTETLTPVGDITTEDGCLFMLGNWVTATKDYDRSIDGKLADARVYDRILEQADVTALFNSGVIDPSLVTDGLLSQGPAIRSKDYDNLLNQELTGEANVVDNINGYVGEPNDAPMVRAMP